MSERYDLPFTAAYIRGTLRGRGPLYEKPLSALSDAECLALMEAARAENVKLHHFKRFEELPRVRTVLGFLRAVSPESLLDVGSGRGVFLFPFLRQFPSVPVASMEISDSRAALLDAVRLGGVDELTVLRENICACAEEDGAFDVVTMLEVLEHIPDAAAAVRSAVRLARRFVMLTVPSKPDSNPEHIHLFSKDSLTALFEAAGCQSLRFDGVPGHLVLFAKKG